MCPHMRRLWPQHLANRGHVSGAGDARWALLEPASSLMHEQEPKHNPHPNPRPHPHPHPHRNPDRKPDPNPNPNPNPNPEQEQQELALAHRQQQAELRGQELDAAGRPVPAGQAATP